MIRTTLLLAGLTALMMASMARWGAIFGTGRSSNDAGKRRNRKQEKEAASLMQKISGKT